MSSLRKRRGTVYLVCFAGTPYQHARHYCGFAYPDDDLAGASTAILAEIALARCTRITRRKLTALQATGVALRIARHRAGTGSNLLAVAGAAGSEFTITRIWTSVTEHTEKALKDLNDRVGLCPVCTPGTQKGNVVNPKRYRRPRRKVVDQCPDTSRSHQASDSAGVPSSIPMSADVALTG